MAKYVFVTGGVVSGLGKGVTAASIGRLLKSRGLRVTAVKLDPYINVDPGTMSPYQHGEVFVTEDGAETDLDLGHMRGLSDIDSKSKWITNACILVHHQSENERWLPGRNVQGHSGCQNARSKSAITQIGRRIASDVVTSF